MGKTYPPYDPKKNYCGPDGLLKFPRTVYGVDCNYAFYCHDRDYSQGGTLWDIFEGRQGTEEARYNCDRAMYDIMMFYIRCAFKWWDPRRVLAWRRCRKYYLAVRAGGWLFFNRNKGKGDPSDDQGS